MNYQNANFMAYNQGPRFNLQRQGSSFQGQKHFQRQQPLENIPTCYRCQKKGHPVNQCRTNLNNVLEN